MGKKVTSYRLHIDTLEKLEKLVQHQNEYSRELAAVNDSKPVKFTRADIIELLINFRYYDVFDSEK